MKAISGRVYLVHEMRQVIEQENGAVQEGPAWLELPDGSIVESLDDGTYLISRTQELVWPVGKS